MTVKELIERLREIDSSWEVAGTASGSLEVWDPDGKQYGWVFTDKRSTKIVNRRTQTRTEGK